MDIHAADLVGDAHARDLRFGEPTRAERRGVVISLEKADQPRL
jgi:hypothetical protein